MSYLLDAIKKINFSDTYFTPLHVVDYIEAKGNGLKVIYGNPHFKEEEEK